MGYWDTYTAPQSAAWNTFTNAMTNWQTDWTPAPMNNVPGSSPYMNFDAQAAAIQNQTQQALNALMNQTAATQAKVMQDTAKAISDAQAQMQKETTALMGKVTTPRLDISKIAINPTSIIGDTGSKAVTSILSKIQEGYDALDSIEKMMTSGKKITQDSEAGMVLDNIQRRKVDLTTLGELAINTAKEGTIGNIGQLIDLTSQKPEVVDLTSQKPATIDLTGWKPVTQQEREAISQSQPGTFAGVKTPEGTPAGWQNVTWEGPNEFMQQITPKTIQQVETIQQVDKIAQDITTQLDKGGYLHGGEGNFEIDIPNIGSYSFKTEKDARKYAQMIANKYNVTITMQATVPGYDEGIGTSVYRYGTIESHHLTEEDQPAVTEEMLKAREETKTQDIKNYDEKTQKQIKSVLGDVKQFTIADYNKAVTAASAPKTVSQILALSPTEMSNIMGQNLITQKIAPATLPGMVEEIETTTGKKKEAPNLVTPVTGLAGLAAASGTPSWLKSAAMALDNIFTDQKNVLKNQGLIEEKTTQIGTEGWSLGGSLKTLGNYLMGVAGGKTADQAWKESTAITKTVEVPTEKGQKAADYFGSMIALGANVEPEKYGLTKDTMGSFVLEHANNNIKSMILFDNPKQVSAWAYDPRTAALALEKYGSDNVKAANSVAPLNEIEMTQIGQGARNQMVLSAVGDMSRVTGNPAIDIPLFPVMALGLGNEELLGAAAKGLNYLKDVKISGEVFGGLQDAKSIVRAVNDFRDFAATAKIGGVGGMDLTNDIVKAVGGDVLFVPKGGQASILDTSKLMSAALSDDPGVAADAITNMLKTTNNQVDTVASIINEATKKASYGGQPFTLIDANKVIMDAKIAMPQSDAVTMIEKSFHELQGITPVKVQAPTIGGLAEAREMPMTPETMDAMIQQRLEKSIAGQTANAKNELASQISTPVADALEKFGIRPEQSGSVRQLSLLGDKDFTSIAKNVQGITKDEAIAQLKDIKKTAADLRSTIKLDTTTAIDNVKSVLANADTTTLDAFRKKTTNDIKNMIADWQLTSNGRELTTAEKNALSQQMYALKGEVADEIDTRNVIGKWSEYAKQKSGQNELIFDEGELNRWMKENHPEIIAEDEKTSYEMGLATEYEDYLSGLEAKPGTFRRPDAVLSPDEFLQWSSYKAKAGTEILSATEKADDFVKEMKSTDYYKSLRPYEQEILEKDVRSIIQGRVLPQGEWKALETSLQKSGKTLTGAEGKTPATQVASQKLLDHSIVGGSDQTANYLAKKQFNQLANQDIKDGLKEVLAEMEYKSPTEQKIMAADLQQSGYGEMELVGMTKEEAMNAGLYPWEYTQTEMMNAPAWDARSVISKTGEFAPDVAIPKNEQIQTTLGGTIAKPGEQIAQEATRAPVLQQLEEMGRPELLDGIRSGEIKNIAEVSPDELLSVPMKDINALRGTGPDSKLIDQVMNERAKISRDVMTSWGDVGELAAKKAESGEKFTKAEMDLMLQPENLQISVDALWTSKGQRNIGEEALQLIKNEYTAGKMGIDEALAERDTLLSRIDEIKKVACV